MDIVPFFKSRGLRYPHTVVVLASSNAEWRPKSKEFIEKETGYAVFPVMNPYEAIHMIQVEFELNPVILVAEHGVHNDYTGLQLIAHAEQRRLFPLVSFFVHDHYDDKLFGEAKRAGAIECFPIYGLPPGAPEYNLGDSFRDAIRGSERFLRWQFMAYMDPLTSDLDRDVYVYNRLGSRERWKHTWREAQKTSIPPSCVFIDLVGFGKANTELHADGDRIIGEVSAVLCHSIRPTDYILRFGGDEFILFLPKTNKFQARTVVERLRKLLQGSTFTLKSGRQFQVDLRAGLVTPTRNQMHLEADVVYSQLENQMNKLERAKKAKQLKAAA